jgi:hypothetical protein
VSRNLVLRRISRQPVLKVVRLSALHTGHLYHQDISLALISVRVWVDPRSVARPQRLRHLKIPVTQSGIEPATFLLVAQLVKALPQLSFYRIPNY